MDIKKLVLIVFLSLMVSGCVFRSTAHSGKDFDETKAAQIIAGKTTESQLISMLGEPVKKEVVSDHEVKWVYEYVTSNAAVRMFSVKPKVDVTKKTLEVLMRDGIAVNHALTNPGMTQY